MNSEGKFLRELKVARFLYIRHHPSEKLLEFLTHQRFMKIRLPRFGMRLANPQAYLKMNFSDILRIAKLDLQ
jgi:hypothetical protein